MVRTKTLNRILLLLLALILACGTATSLSVADYSYASNESENILADSNDGTIKATLIKGSQIKDGDTIIIAASSEDKALSTQTSDSKVASTSVVVRETVDTNTLTSISDNTALLAVEKAGDEGSEFYLKCSSGYLTSGETGNSLFYRAEPSEYSKWTFENDNLVHSANAHFDSSKNQFLEYFNGAFTTYGKNSTANPTPFTMNFYLWGDDSPTEDDTGYYLPVFETSDTHGSIAEKSGNEYLYLLAYISDKIKDVRGYGQNNRKDKALFLDGGDIYQGNIISNAFYGKPLSAAYQFMEYDAVTVGNHEFDWGIERVCDTDHTMTDYKVGDESGINTVPIVVSNIYKNGSDFEYADKYRIFEKTATDKNGNETKIKVGVVGFAGNYASSIKQDMFSGRGYSIDYDITKANDLARGLEESGQCDITILLAHDDAAELAPQLQAGSPFDLVLGGHTHRNTNGITEWGLRYIEPASNGRAYAQCELAFKLEDNKPQFKKVVNAKTVNTKDDLSALKKSPGNTDNLDPRIVEITDKAIGDVKEVLDTKVGYITESVLRFTFLPDSGDRSTTCGNWFTSLIARASGADIAFTNSAGLRIELPLENGATKRDITLADIHDLFPFNNMIYLFELTYDDLLTALKYSLSDRGKTLLSTINGIDCYFVGEEVKEIITSCGEVIYTNGTWKEGWSTKKVKVTLLDFPATTQRISSNGLANPFCEWAHTSKLLSSDVEDFDGILPVLKEEAKNNNSHLSIDTTPHYLNHQYSADDAQRYTGHNFVETIKPATLTEDGAVSQKCTRCGKTIELSTIKRINTVSLNQTSFSYDGKIHKPAVSVKDSTGREIPSQYYSVSYLDNKKAPLGNTMPAGTYYARVTFKDYYKGTKDIPYSITKAPSPVTPKVSGTLLALMNSKGKTELQLKWSKIKGASGYDIFFSRCNHAHENLICKRVKNIKGNKTFTWTKTGLLKGAAYKANVKAYILVNGKKKYVKQSPQVHAYTDEGNSKFTNAKRITINSSKISLKKGKVFKIKASISKAKNSQSLMTKGHVPTLRFMSLNNKIATVSKSGKVIARSKGKCAIWIYAHNGIYKKLEVTTQ